MDFTTGKEVEEVDGKLNVALKLRRGRGQRPHSVLNSGHLWKNGLCQAAIYSRYVFDVLVVAFCNTLVN